MLKSGTAPTPQCADVCLGTCPGCTEPVSGCDAGEAAEAGGLEARSAAHPLWSGVNQGSGDGRGENSGISLACIYCAMQLHDTRSAVWKDTKLWLRYVRPNVASVSSTS